MNKDISAQFLCKDCANYNLCKYYHSRKKDSYICKYFHLVETNRQDTRWIPVSERLPERNKNVIVTDFETSDTYQSQYLGNRYWECDNGAFKNRIIAWMPLPEPYKAERKD